MIEETDFGLQADLGGLTVEAHLKQNMRMQVRVVHGDDDTVLYSNEYAHGWWTVDQHAGQIRNQVAEKLAGPDTPIDPEYWRGKWAEFLTELNEFAEEATAEQLPKSAEAKHVIDATERVVVHPGDDTEWHVMATIDGHSGTLVFDQETMSQTSPGAFREEFSRVFYTTPDIQEPEEWADIRERWQAMQEVMDPVGFTNEDIIVESFIDDLRARITPISDANDLENSPETAWYDETNEKNVGHEWDGAVLWVKRETVEAVRSSLHESITAAKLSKELLNKEITIATSQARQVAGFKTRFWYFAPEELGISWADVREATPTPENQEVTP